MEALSGTIRPLLERFRVALHRRFGDRLREITVFGSWARRDTTEESDLDALVLVDGLTDSEHREVIAIACDVDGLDDESFGLSPLVYSTEQATELRNRGRQLFINIAAEGIPA